MPLFASGMLAGAVLLAQSRPEGDAAASSIKGKSAPAWELKDLNGKTIRSTTFSGRVVILSFWATWCPPCRAEIPTFNALQKQYGDQGLAVVGISMDDGPEVVKPFVQKAPINYQVVMGDNKTAEAFGATEGIPTTFIIDREGRIVSRHLGLRSHAEFETEIKPLLKP